MHPTENAAHSVLKSSLNAFVVSCAYVSFLNAWCQLSGLSSDSPSYFSCRLHPEFLKMFLQSHIVNFSGGWKCIGTIINVLQCGWISIADVLLKAKVPIWFYWGNHLLTVTPWVGWMTDSRPQLIKLNVPPANNSLPPTHPSSQLQSSAVLSHQYNTKVELPP